MENILEKWKPVEKDGKQFRKMETSTYREMENSRVGWKMRTNTTRPESRTQKVEIDRSARAHAHCLP